ncbi:uncharacterized protein LOC101858333 [Aplysia californica]|uniref:Uncharacterized protein LOC101858333 n=1 Tax=Aplysia californica TaxID=6500 RepID=A0ABM1VQM1_APLCA|nr:uncharacterized protein LOC101858333 [Aplysia californica]XP_005094726.1 uncharacterized protein LOC101858333 [Aplysia californica]XP_035824713.1 uncharacterized protein LOC101858333 [Aplysia californica]
MADDKTGLLSGSRPSPPPAPSSGSSVAATNITTGAVYHDSTQSPTARLLQLVFVALVVVMVLVTLSLSVYRGLDVDTDGSAYFLQGVSLIGFVVIEVMMIIFTRRGDLPKGKSWFLYLVGFCVMLEAIFTDVLLFQ